MELLRKKREKKQRRSPGFFSFSQREMHGVLFDRLSLRFISKENESKYIEAHHLQNLQHVRSALLVAVFLFMLLGALDYYLLPGEHWRMWSIRLLAMAPFTLLLVLFSYTKEWRVVQPAAAFAMLIAGVTNIAIVINNSDYLGSVYFVGMILFLLYGYTVLRLRYLWMVRAGLGMILFYEIIALFVSHLDPETFLINNIFLIAANISGMFASYVIEYFSRRDFVQNMLLSNSADDLALSLSERGTHLKEFIRNSKEVILFQLRIEGDTVKVEEVSPIIREKFGLDKTKVNEVGDWFGDSEKGAEIVKLLKSNTNKGGSLDMEIESILTDREKRWFRLITLAANDRRSQSVNIFGMLLDITDGKEKTKRQKELMDQKNRFLNVISHQFNTPLNVVKWATETLRSQESGVLNQSQQALAIGMEKASDKMIEVLRDVVVGMAILEGRSVSLRKETFTVAEFIMPAVGSLDMKMQNRKIYFAGKSLDSVLVEGDPEKLQIAVTKIIDNALDYGEEGTDIAISLEKRGKEAVITFKNTGIPVSKKEEAKAFDLFYRGKLALRKQPNRSGVGLSLARFYVEAHGGSVDLAGNKNEVIVTITLPLA